jgi:hypothetical protein
MGSLKMKTVNPANICDFPFHDAEILNFSIKQSENGDTGLRMNIRFLVDEVKELDDTSVDYIGKNGETTFFLNDCRWIDFEMFCNSSKRDQIDYIEILKETEKLKEFESLNKGYFQIEITFISGSILRVISQESYLTIERKGWCERERK